MNIQSEIEFFSDLGLVDKARFTFQLLSEDAARPADDVMIRMLLGHRADKNAERIMQNAYRRVLTSFESFDTTVLLNSH